MTTVELQDVGKVWDDPQGRGRTIALEGVSHRFASGSTTCILGPSGCGKSTLLEIVAGIEQPTSGRLVGPSRTAGQVSRPDAIVVWQSFHLFPWLSVLDNVAFGLEVRGVSRRDRSEIARGLLQQVGLLRFAEHRPGQLSGGMKQRVCLARALAIDAPVLLMDEPFGALDAQTRMVMQEELLGLLEGTEKTVIFITHSIDEAFLLGDEVLVMSASPGRIVDRIPVEIPGRRSHSELRGSAYQGLFDRAYELLRSEVERASGPIGSPA